MITATPAPWRRRVMETLATVALAIVFFVPVSTVLDASLDASNYASYTSFAAGQRQFGTEVAPMAGPLGFVVYGWVFNGELYGTRLALELLTKLVFAALVLWLFRRCAATRFRWLWLAANVAIVPGTGELSYDLAILYAGLALVFELRRHLLTAALAAFLGMLALYKGTHLILTLAVVALAAGHAIARRAWSELAITISSYVVALAALWCAAGQNLFHFPAYVHNILELSSGYSSGMAVQESFTTFAVGVTLLSLLLCGIGLIAVRAWRNPSVVTATLLLAGFAFAQWKHGFVRADGHVFLFFNYTLVAGVTALLVGTLAGTASRLSRTQTAVCAIGLVVAAFATGGDSPQRWRNQAIGLPQLVRTSFQQITHPAATRRHLVRELEASRIRFALPEVAQHVGHGSIDFFGYQGGYLPLNHLEHEPHPVAGGGPFSVFTPHLQKLNRDFVLSAERPDFYLLKLQTIDGRWVAQDDAGSLDAILHLYRPVMAERGMLLFRSDATLPPPPAPRELSRHRLRFGESIAVPLAAADEVVLASFELPLSIRGRARAVLYKSPIVSLHGRVPGASAAIVRRIIPPMAAQPFIVSPFLDTTDDLLTLYTPGAGRPVNQLELSADPAWGLSSRECTVTFYAQRRPAPLDAPSLAALSEQLQYPASNRAPDKIEARNARLTEIEGRMVQQLEPPGTMVFSLKGNERELLFDYGFDPEAYTRGTTDGADFIVELNAPDRAPEQLYLDRRTPKTTVSDRGRHHAHLWLPIVKPGTQLVLRTGGGVHGATDWDWTYFDNIRLHSGRYRIEQFPGFAVAPIEAEGNSPRNTTVEGRDVLLLNSPGHLVFALKGTEQHLKLVAGLLPGSYVEGKTDGAELLVEIQPPGQGNKTIFKRWLQPRTVESDRGTLPIDVPLPPLPRDTRLTLRVGPGPHGDFGWDWSYVGNLRFE